MFLVLGEVLTASPVLILLGFQVSVPFLSTTADNTHHI